MKEDWSFLDAAVAPPEAPTLEPGRRFMATIRLRDNPPFPDWRAKDRQNGTRVLVEVGWLLNLEHCAGYAADERVMLLRGESALRVCGGWVASGDLVDWEPVAG